MHELNNLNNASEKNLINKFSEGDSEDFCFCVQLLHAPKIMKVVVAHFRLVKCPSAIRDHLGFFIFVLAAFFVQAFIESGHRSRTYGR